MQIYLVEEHTGPVTTLPEQPLKVVLRFLNKKKHLICKVWIFMISVTKFVSKPLSFAHILRSLTPCGCLQALRISSEALPRAPNTWQLNMGLHLGHPLVEFWDDHCV